MKEKNPDVDAFLSKTKNWKQELEQLRKIVLDYKLTEELKWGNPCYTFNGANILMIAGFKEYCALAFFKGALLKDTDGLLVKAGENSQSARQLRFTGVQEIVQNQSLIIAYVKEAILVEKAGLKIGRVNPDTLELPDEFRQILEKNAALNKAFYALTPGRQRAYIMFFAAPKQSATRITRVEKYMQQILNGKGINDCTCGLSKKMPSCDGSHKFIKK